MDLALKNTDIRENIAAQNALIHYLMDTKKGKNLSVMMPYSSKLKYISDWYVQLWAESLGKEFDNNGNKVNVGPTPIKALGVTDQHSQIQCPACSCPPEYRSAAGAGQYMACSALCAPVRSWQQRPCTILLCILFSSFQY